MRSHQKETAPIRSRPQYHYFYGSTNASAGDVSESSVAGTDADTILLGECLVQTDNEEETPNSSAQDLRHLVVTTKNGHSRIKHAYQLEMPIPEAQNGRRSPHSPRRKSIWLLCAEQCLNLGGVHPVGHVTRIIVILVSAISMGTCILVLLPNPTTTSTGAANARSSFIPFQIVDRANFNDPAAKIVNLDLFDPSLRFQGGQKLGKRTFQSSSTGVDPVLRVPFPTGAFWTNLVVEPDGHGISFPIVSYPYAFKWSDSLLQASYPACRRNVDSTSTRHIFQPDIVFGTSEAIAKRHVMKFDPLSVTLRYFANTDGFWETYIVHGSPYITIKYSAVTPVFTTRSRFLKVICPFDSDGNYNDGEARIFSKFEGRHLKWGVCTDSSSSTLTQETTLSGVQFLLQTQDDLTWILFASEPIALTFDSEGMSSVSSLGKFTGVLRLALIPPTPVGLFPTNNTALLPLSVSTGLKRLVYHAGLYPTGGSVTWNFHASTTSSSSSTSNSRRKGTVQFQFQTALMTDTGSSQQNTNQNQLLMLGLPHHAELLSPDIILSSKTFDLEYRCIKGFMSPIVGSTWSYDEMLTSTGFDSPETMALPFEVRNIILDSVKRDLRIILPDPAESTYGYAKQLARLAQLAHVARVTTHTSTRIRNHTDILTDHLSTLAAATDKLHTAIIRILDGEVHDELLYDAKFGGIVSRNGLVDKNGDFGNGRYNDHHFHYGYILYACAVMGSLNSSFVDNYGPFVDNLLFDVAYHGNSDSATVDDIFFPLARHKSWYDGHSFGSGLDPFANGKSQEGSSEAVNCYYGAYLWSSIRKSNSLTQSVDMVDYARLLLATEIRGAKTYWHMTPTRGKLWNRTTSLWPAIYDDMFASSYMVGNMGMLDAVSSTWFGNAPLLVHMINFMPATAITNELFSTEYVEQEYTNVIVPLHTNISNAWKGYALCDHAIIDPSVAWLEAQSLVSAELDSALSKSQVLYWISSHSRFNYTSSSDDDSPVIDRLEDKASNSSGILSSSCEDNADCALLGLTGFCCPTGKGSILGCCDDF